MSDAEILVSEAGRALAVQRWGSTRIDRLVSELHDRAAELGERQLCELQELLDTVGKSAETPDLPAVTRHERRPRRGGSVRRPAHRPARERSVHPGGHL